jgi:hypothetical protein
MRAASSPPLGATPSRLRTPPPPWLYRANMGNPRWVLHRSSTVSFHLCVCVMLFQYHHWWCCGILSATTFLACGLRCLPGFSWCRSILSATAFVRISCCYSKVFSLTLSAIASSVPLHLYSMLQLQYLTDSLVAT